ncbi:MAG: hypothetical protein JSS49_13115 [Planctomycetes bacterium]|nr:hypothetical protein [Planctomycetota bacterium]
MKTLAQVICLMLFMGTTYGWCQDDVNASNEEDEKIRRLVEERRLLEAEQAKIPTSLDRGEMVNPELLDVVTDNSIGVRFEEKDAYFRILELARKTPLAEQEEYALNFREARRLSNPKYSRLKPEKFPIFVDLFLSPDVYRGRPVTLHGVLRKLTKFDPGPNSRDVGEAYEGWVYPDDGQSNPAVVIFQSKPDGLQVGGDLSEEVRVTGYFFKMYGYEAQDVARKAPMILAGAIEWRPGPGPYVPQALGPEVYLGLTMTIFLVGFVWWQSNRREMTSAIHPTEADFRSFPPIETPTKSSSVGEKLTETHDE